MAYILLLIGIYMIVASMRGNAVLVAEEVWDNAESAGVWLIGWIVLLVAAKIWRPFYYIAILALIVYVLDSHESLFTQMTAIYHKIEGLQGSNTDG